MRQISRIGRRLGVVLLLLTLNTAWAQTTVTLRGRIQEESKAPLANANVRLITPAGKLQGGMATTAHGTYTISGIPAGTYTLEVSYIGYKTHSESIKLTADKRMPDIVLLEDGKLLSDLVVAGKATEVVVRGDTIEYNAESFKTAEGAALEELIKRLPGAEISETGEIKINGKSITQIMVDGKRFFETDPKVAAKNLPADLIEKVQVLDKASDAARMTGFADGDDETIINLTIKPGRKTGLFGTAYAGVGTKQRYEANAMINRFVDKKQWTILGGANNTNNAGFSDIASDLSQSALAQQANGSNRRPWQRNNSNDGITASRILGGNLALTLGSKIELGGNAFLGNSDKETVTNSETTNIQATGNTYESARIAEQNNKYNAGLAARLEWKPDDKTEIIIAPQITFGTGRGHYVGSSHTTLESTGATITRNQLTQSTQSRVYNGRLQADLSRKLGTNGRTFALSIDARLGGDISDGNYQNDIYTASTASTSRVDQRIEHDSRTANFRTRLNYVEPLGGGYALQLTYQLRGEFATTERDAYQADISGAYTIPNHGYSYAFSSTYWAHRAGFAVKKSNKVYDLTAGLNIDPSSLISQTKRLGLTRRITQTVVNYSPTLRFSYKPSRAFNLRIDYRGQSFQPTASQLAPIEDTTNPLIVYQGNEGLRPGYRHHLFGNVSLFSTEKQSSLNLFLMGRLVQNEIVSSAIYDIHTGVRTISYANVNGSWMTALGGFYTTPLPWKRLSLRIGTRNSLNNQIGFVDGTRNNARSLALNESLTLSYRHGFLDTSLSGSWGYHGVNNSVAGVPGQTAQEYGLGWDANITLPLGFTLESQLQYTKTNGYARGYDQEQTMLNLGISYSFLAGRAASLRFKVYDLLGQRRNVYREVSPIAISSQETNTLGQYAMLHFIYRFNSFSGNASATDMKQTDRRGPGAPPPGRL